MSRLLRIIALGDSLTTGFQSPTFENPDGVSTPYGEFLQERLGASAEVSIRGMNGELTDAMLLRLGTDVIPKQPDAVVILGGANDLGWGVKPPEILRNLVAMYERSHAAGIRPIAVTVPSIRGADSLIPSRRELNRRIFDYCRTRAQACVDLFTATAESGTQRLAADYSNDGLHLTTEGYRLLADLLYEQVFKSSEP